MMTPDDISARSQVIAASADLRALLAHLRDRAQPVLERMPTVPEHKALLSMDGGICPDDGTTLTFDPWSPSQHRCPRCGKTWTGERHDWHWARYQHLWLAERAAHLATLAALDRDDAAAGARARDLLLVYAERYWRYPNRDNTLGPSRLFFSTYLESVWVCNYVAAAWLLKAAGRMDDAAVRGVNQVIEEAATLIGDYDESFSNRQSWNNAALASIAVWFEDEDLAQRAIEGQTGLLAHLVRGYGRDGMWYEGENYHLFALRGLLIGIGWARLAGVEVVDDPGLVARLEAALRAPALSALPDFTFPARKDARFGVSLAQPAYLELWEIGLARLVRGERYAGRGDLLEWLNTLYAVPTPEPELLEYYLHDTDRSPRTAHRGRGSLSWWALLEMLPDLPKVETPWSPPSVLLESQGLAVLRADKRYVSLECGPYGGGHGHPDRLHLTLHADGVHWLADPGTGSYVARELFWYRSTLAHNAPLLDGESQPPGDARCECFDDQHEWAWVRGRYGNITRTVVAGPEYLVDVCELSGREEHVVELPWHVAGRGDVETRGRWVTDEIPDEFVTRAERFVPDTQGPVAILHAERGAKFTAHLWYQGELLRAQAPGKPSSGVQTPFYVIRTRGRNARIVAVLEPHVEESRVHAIRVAGETIEVEAAAGSQRHRSSAAEWTVERSDGTVVLKGARVPEPPFTPYLELDAPLPVVAPAFRVSAAPALDGSVEGFDVAEPLQLALEDQYRRSEDSYPGPEELSAVAYAAWDEAALYLAVEVTKPELCLRRANAAPLRLDNEPDDIHSDGLQVYVAAEHGENGAAAPVGYLIVPEPNSTKLRVSTTSDTIGKADPASVRGAWRRRNEGDGYRVTLAIPWPPDVRPHAGARVRFDLIVNELLPGRVRRVGQLVWSGGGGWVWLRGDRQDPARFGVLELVG